MAGTGIKSRKITEIFNGQSDIVLFDEPSGGYTADTTFANVTASGMSLGQVVEDSTSWEGEDPSIDSIKDEQGDIIVSSVTAGIGTLSGVLKFVELPITTRPIAIFNDEANKWILLPKAKIVGNLTLDNKLWRIHIVATAEYVNTATLGTFMMGKGTPIAASES